MGTMALSFKLVIVLTSFACEYIFALRVEKRRILRSSVRASAPFRGQLCCGLERVDAFHHESHDHLITFQAPEPRFITPRAPFREPSPRFKQDVRGTQSAQGYELDYVDNEPAELDIDQSCTLEALLAVLRENADHAGTVTQPLRQAVGNTFAVVSAPMHSAFDAIKTRLPVPRNRGGAVATTVLAVTSVGPGGVAQAVAIMKFLFTNNYFLNTVHAGLSAAYSHTQAVGVWNSILAASKAGAAGLPKMMSLLPCVFKGVAIIIALVICFFEKSILHAIWMIPIGNFLGETIPKLIPELDEPNEVPFLDVLMNWPF